MRRHTMRTFLALGCAGLVGCAGAPVTPEQQRLAEARLLAPFEQAIEVGCSELQIEMTGNFYGDVGRPTADAKFQREVTTQGDGYTETTWTNLTGRLDSAFKLTIGKPPEITERGLVKTPRMEFTVLNQLRIRIYTKVHALALDAVAGGGLVVVKGADGRARDRAEVRIADGVMSER